MRTAFTLMEILLASIIFIIAVAGMLATLSAVRQPVLQKERALTASIFGQQELETLRNQVSANNIISNSDGYAYQGNLALKSYSFNETDPNNLNYIVNYTVSCDTLGKNGLCAQDTAVVVNETITFPDA